MPNLEQDRTGEECPFCHTGKLHPTGKTIRKENPGVVSGEMGYSYVEYECDLCHKKTDASGINLGFGVSASPKVSFSNPDESKPK